MPDVEITLRLIAACIVGAVIGLNRDLRSKPIGMRTLAIVSLGAAAISAAALRYEGIPGDAEATARVLQDAIQGVLIGVGFIGAGVILRVPDKQIVHGLTTAATVWITAALGIMCGIADGVVVGAATVLTLAILSVLLWIEWKLGKRDTD